MPSLAVRYAHWATLKDHIDKQLAHGGLFLPRDLGLAQFTPVKVEISTPAGTLHELGCEVVQVIPGAATALAVKGGGNGAIEAIRAEARAAVVEGAAPENDPMVLTEAERADEERAQSDEGDDAPNLSPSDVSLQAKLAEMSIAELRHQAVHGGKEMRFLLLRHQNKSLHPFVLKNPALQLDEIEAAARMTSLNPNALHEIALHRDWTKATGVVRALVRNPKTPIPDALRMAEKLPLPECQALVKSGALRMPILMALKKRARGG